MARSQLAKIQRVMYRRLQGYAKHHSPTTGPELKRYFREYLNELREFQRTAKKPELIRAVQRSRIVIVGDYHTLPQAQRTLVRILRDSPNISAGLPPVLAIEWLRPEDNFTVARYQSGRISESRFLSEVRFQDRWGFDWKNYRPLFEVAREKRIQIVGLARDGSLLQRDRFAADRVRAIFELYPQARVFVLMGDLHLAERHLPRELSRSLRRVGLSPRVLTIHQNVERFYWKIAERGLEHRVDLVKVRRGVYCVLNTPPWVKLQSHIQWLESMDTVSDPFQEIDFTQEVHAIWRQLLSFLGLKPLGRAIDPIVTGHRDIAWLKGRSPVERSRIRSFLAHFESFFDSQERRIVLSTLSPNQLAAQTARLLHSHLSNHSNNFRSPKHFYEAVWCEAIGFLGSKILNPRRKCNGIDDLRRIGSSRSVRVPHREFVVTPEVARAAVTYLDREPKLVQNLPSHALGPSLVFHYKVAKILGHLLGHGIYQGALSRKISKVELANLFHHPLTEADGLYRKWIKRLDRHRLRRHSKRDSL